VAPGLLRGSRACGVDLFPQVSIAKAVNGLFTPADDLQQSRIGLDLSQLVPKFK
jgi:hypothetical protein